MGRVRHRRQKEKQSHRSNRWFQDGEVDENGRPLRGFKDIVKENELFEKFYKNQKLIRDDEWDSFMATLRDNLPVSFRVTGFRSEAETLRKIIEEQLIASLIQHEDSKGEKVEITPLPWYPGGSAWQLNLTRSEIRKTESYLRLHNFLISETETGNISRQEAVSMIPPIVLDVKPHHKVLDMCAAPGSKTAQIIELLHEEEGKLPEGLVIANDADNKRCYMLVHQAKRLQSPCVLVTNHDAAVMPNIVVTKPDGCKTHLKFDRILCDVPCTGDGTLRKNTDVWMKWTAANANNLHGLQFRIAKRGIEMLTVGGRLVYSTCSMNPVEDEAVIARLIKETEGSVQLIDASNLVPGLKFTAGVTEWKLMDKDGDIFDKFKDVPPASHNIIRPSMFPSDHVKDYGLDRCMRIFPHQQNTGGFFVAVLEKVKPLPGEVTDVLVSEEKKKDVQKKPPRKKRKLGFREDPFVYFTEEEEIWPDIKNFYGLSDTLSPTMFLSRCFEGKKKNIYFSSSVVRDIVISNQDNIKVINTGLKAFVRTDNRGSCSCSFRLTQEGLDAIFPYLRSRRVFVTSDDVVTLMLNSSADCPPRIAELDAKTQEQLHNIETGSTAMVYRKDATESSPALQIALVGWKGKTSIRAYVPKNERIHYLRLCGVDTSKFEKNKFLGRATSDTEKIETVEPSSRNQVVKVENVVNTETDTYIRTEETDVKDESRLSEQNKDNGNIETAS